MAQVVSLVIQVRAAILVSLASQAQVVSPAIQVQVVSLASRVRAVSLVSQVQVAQVVHRVFQVSHQLFLNILQTRMLHQEIQAPAIFYGIMQLR